MKPSFLTPLALCAAAAVAGAQDVGTRLPDVRLEGLSQTRAESFDQFFGRTVLLEFFAHW